MRLGVSGLSYTLYFMHNTGKNLLSLRTYGLFVSLSMYCYLTNKYIFCYSFNHFGQVLYKYFTNSDNDNNICFEDTIVL